LPEQYFLTKIQELFKSKSLRKLYESRLTFSKICIKVAGLMLFITLQTQMVSLRISQLA